MIIKKITSKIAEEFLQKNFSAPTHWPDWNIFISQSYNTYFFYLGAFKENNLVGVCPIHETKYKKILKYWHSGQYQYIPYGGWIFSEELESEIIQQKKFNTAFNSFSLPIIKEFGTTLKIKNSDYRKTLLINLLRSQEDIWTNSIHSKRRNMIRKAEKNEISVKKAKTIDDLKAFYFVYSESCERLKLKILSYDFFENMFLKTKNISLDIFMAYKNNIQLANVATISDKNYSLYWLGNSANNVKNEGQGELLQWEAIKEMKNKGCKYYDLCFIEPEKLLNIYKFKKGFSNQEELIQIINVKSLFFKIINKIFNVFSV